MLFIWARSSILYTTGSSFLQMLYHLLLLHSFYLINLFLILKYIKNLSFLKNILEVNFVVFFKFLWHKLDVPNLFKFIVNVFIVQRGEFRIFLIFVYCYVILCNSKHKILIFLIGVLKWDHLWCLVKWIIFFVCLGSF